MTARSAPSYVLALSGPDRAGIVAAVSTWLAERGLTIGESAHHGDMDTGLFYMRTEFRAVEGALPPIDALETAFAPVAERFSLSARFHDASRRPRVIIAVSRFGHCLYDLMHRWRTGLLPIEVVAVISNHEDMRSFVEWNGVPYHWLPVDAARRADQEEQFLALVSHYEAELVVLARYMQILSDTLCRALSRRCINIHHSFLPSFKGAKPYHQAHARGVKIIGATAHYVTEDLDEGPIIEQAVERVDHSHSPEDLVEIGRDVECTVLTRAVRWHAEARVMLNGAKTVVFA